MNYEELVMSEWGFICAEAQEKIRDSRVLLPGFWSQKFVIRAVRAFPEYKLVDPFYFTPVRRLE